MCTINGEDLFIAHLKFCLSQIMDGSHMATILVFKF